MSDETPSGARTEPWVFTLVGCALVMLVTAVLPDLWRKLAFGLAVVLFLGSLWQLQRQQRSS